MDQLELEGVTSEVSAVYADIEDAPDCGRAVAGPAIPAVAYKVRSKSTHRWSRGGTRPWCGGNDHRSPGKTWARLGDVKAHLRQLENINDIHGTVDGSAYDLADMEVVELRESGLFAGRVVPALELLNG